MGILIFCNKIMKLTVISLNEKFLILNFQYPQDKRVAELYYSNIEEDSYEKIKECIKNASKKRFKESVIRLEITKDAKEMMKKIACKNLK